MTYLRPFQIHSGTLRLTLLGRPGKPVALETVVASSLDFSVEIKPMHPATNRVTMELKFEVLTSSLQDTLVTAYFIGRAGNHSVVHPFKVFLSVAFQSQSD